MSSYTKDPSWRGLNMAENQEEYGIGRYAVARADGLGFKFPKLHTGLESAEKEAERLCSETKGKFMVLEVVGRCEPACAPVKWTERKEFV